MSLFEAPATAAPPRLPAGPWQVDYDEAQCVAMRQYGTAEKPLILVFKPSANATVMRILVIRKGTTDAEQTPVTLRFGEKVLRTNLLHYWDDKNHYRIVSINVPMSDFKANLAAPSISIVGSPINETFAVSDVPKLAAELDKCVLDLQQYWNIGPQYAARVKSPGQPTPPLKGLFSPNDYPGIALRQNQQGAVTMTFLVDETGKVADCTEDGTSGIPVLDTMSCYVVQKRAHFQPALGPDGKPVRSAYTEKVVWRIGP